MAQAESKILEWVREAKEGSPDLNERTRKDAVLASVVARAMKTVYEEGLNHEATLVLNKSADTDPSLRAQWAVLRYSRANELALVAARGFRPESSTQ